MPPDGQRHATPTAGELFRHEPARSTRDRLIDAAIERFYTHGIHAVGLDAVCADAGISKQAFYRHFESKDALVLEAIAKRDALESRAFVEMVGERANTPREKLLAAFDVLDLWFSHPDYEGCLFVTACHEFPSPTDPVHEAASRHLANNEAWLATVARDAGADEPGRLARALALLMQGAVTYRLASSDDHSARTARDAALPLLERHLPPDA